MKLVFKFDSGKVISHEVFERTFKIGRAESCRVTLNNEGFSREHCLIELIDGVVYVTDLGSKNGVFLNHVRIPPKLRVSYDQKLPLYMGEAFVTIDSSADTKDPDHLSLQTFSSIRPEEIFRPLTPPVRYTPKPRPVLTKKKEEEKKDIFSTGLSLVVAVVLIAGIVIYLNREAKHGARATEQHQ